MNHKYLLAAGLTAAALTVTACSSSGSATGGRPGPASGTAAVRSTAHPTASSPPKAQGTQGRGATGFCELAKHDSAVLASLGGDLTKIDSANYQREVARVIAAAPGDIKGDLQAFAEVAIAINKGDKGAEAKLQQPQLVQHVEHYARWMQAHCPGVLDAPSTLPTG